MPNQFKKLYFTSDFSPENIAKLEADGWVLRKSPVSVDDPVESASEYGGDVPEHYKKGQPLTVQIGITPELQAVLDKAKAECEKVVAENDVLKARVAETEDQLKAAQAEITTLKSTPKKPTAAEIKAAKAAEIEAQKDQE